MSVYVLGGKIYIEAYSIQNSNYGQMYRRRLHLPKGEPNNCFHNFYILLLIGIILACGWIACTAPDWMHCSIWKPSLSFHNKIGADYLLTIVVGMNYQADLVQGRRACLINWILAQSLQTCTWFVSWVSFWPFLLTYQYISVTQLTIPVHDLSGRIFLLLLSSLLCNDKLCFQMATGYPHRFLDTKLYNIQFQIPEKPLGHSQTLC